LDLHAARSKTANFHSHPPASKYNVLARILAIIKMKNASFDCTQLTKNMAHKLRTVALLMAWGEIRGSFTIIFASTI